MELKEYMKCVYDLEVSCYEQERLINKISSKLNKERKPQLHQRKDIPKDRSKDEKKSDVISNAILWGIVAGIGGWLIGFGEMFVVLGVYIFGDVVPAFIFGECCLFAIGAAIGSYRAKKAQGKAESAFMQSMQKAMAENRKIDAENNRLRSLAQSRVAILEGQLYRAQKAYGQTKELLDSFYQKDIIWRDYRGLIPVATMYGYLCSGRCSQLEGHEGTYNIYSQELYARLILNKLDDIIIRLDEIKDNQYMLASAIREGNRKADRIYGIVSECADTLHSIDDKETINNYYNGITAMNTTYMAYFKKDW